MLLCRQSNIGHRLPRMKSLKSNLAAVLLALLLAVPAQAAGEWQFDDVGTVVAISDVHGAFDAFVTTLRTAGIIDEKSDWSGGAANLVIVGDLLDRGPRSRDVMDLLMRLEAEAQAAGGRVHVLIGNHEAMNIVGDLRYVAAAEYAAFAGDEDVQERDRWFNAWRSLRAPAGSDIAMLRMDFDQDFPLGYFAHRKAFAADGKYGSWLLGKPAIVVINGTAFVHGGLSPMVAELGLDGVNRGLADELTAYARALQLLFAEQVLLPTDSGRQYEALLSDYEPAPGGTGAMASAVQDIRRIDQSELQGLNGPLWYRGHSFCNELIEVDRLQRSLDAIGAERVVIGHTPTDERRVLQRFDGRIFEIDTGMLGSYYGGSGSALILEGDRIYGINETSAEQVPASPHPRSVGSRPGEPLSTTELERLLQSGTITGRTEQENGRSRVTISGSEHTIEAVFRPRKRRGLLPELAAYRLDRILGLDMVPLTVQRELDGKVGSLQFVPVRWIDEELRGEKKIGGDAYCPLPDQWNAMLIFDALLGNEGRTKKNMLYDKYTWQLMLVDHQSAFRTSGRLFVRLESIELEVGETWKSKLAELSDERLHEQLGELVDKRRIRALAQRRDYLLSR